MDMPWFDSGFFPLFLAPMAGVTDPIFRTLCKELGADVMVTEFVSADGILADWKHNKRYVEFEQSHRPIGVQLFGANSQQLGKAAHIVVHEQYPDFIDINCGCPVPKVVGKNGGSSLLKDLSLLASIVREVVNAVGDFVPVSVKMRIGWDNTSINALETCRILENEGVSMVTIHGRTRSQQYSGNANWDIIEQCAQNISIPVVGNGDVNSAVRVETIHNNTAVRGVMIGRAAMTNPWIFQETRFLLDHGYLPPQKTLEEKWQLIIRHSRMALESGRYGNELHTMKFMRTRLVAYTKGFPNARELRSKLVRIASLHDLEALAHSNV